MIETWAKVKAGYTDLLGYFIFYIVFVLILYMQVNVSSTYTINRSMRDVVVNEERLNIIRTMDDFWVYLVGEASDEEVDVSAGTAVKKKKSRRKKGAGAGGGSDQQPLLEKVFTETWYAKDAL